jgi:hydroxymethylpyrimidine/phosphomethylpyrimidine kinase
MSALTRTPPVALSVAGSDSGGGAGIQADLATFAALGVHGTSAVTAVTVQDTTRVHGIHPVSVDVVVAQVDAVLRDLPVSAVKTGMLGDAAVVHAVTALAAAGRLPNLVVDPIIVSTSGQRLTTPEATEALGALMSHACLVTPNAGEVAVLLGVPVASTLDEHVDQAKALQSLGPRGVVLTGAAIGPDRVDILVTARDVTAVRGRAVDTRNDHGTGCTFASAAAAWLALGADLSEAVTAANSFVRSALVASAGWRLGRGRGPVSHLAPVHHRPNDHRPTDHPSIDHHATHSRRTP